MPERPLFWRRPRAAEPVDPVALQRRLNAAAELLGAARLTLLLDDAGTPVKVASADEPEGPEPTGPSLTAPVCRDGVQVGIVHAVRDRGDPAFAEADRWLLEALAGQLSTGQPRFSRGVDKDTRR